MKSIDRARIIIAAVLITLGVLFLVFNLIPGFNVTVIWPVLLILLGAAALLPPFLWPSARQGLAALFIPGMILIELGLFFVYNVLTGDWSAWAYGWILIPAAVGLGLALAAWVGRWGAVVVWIGLAILASSLIVFTIFAWIFGTPILKAVGPIGLIVVGLLLLLRSGGGRGA